MQSSWGELQSGLWCQSHSGLFVYIYFLCKCDCGCFFCVKQLKLYLWSADLVWWKQSPPAKVHVGGSAWSSCHVSSIQHSLENATSEIAPWPHTRMLSCRITGLVVFQRSSRFPVCTTHSPCPSVKCQMSLNKQRFFTILLQIVFNTVMPLL